MLLITQIDVQLTLKSWTLETPKKMQRKVLNSTQNSPSSI